MYTDEEGVWNFDFDHFERSISPQTKVVMLTNPHNPSGKLWTRDEIERVTEILDRHPHVKVISDDVYFFLPFDGEKHVSFANFSPTNFEKTLSTFSSGKMLNCTGWKVGWMVGPKALVKQAMYVHEANTFNCNVPGQIAVAKSLDQAFNEKYEGSANYLEYTSETFQESRDLCLDMLSKSVNINFKPTACQSGYFMPVDVSDATSHIPDRYFAANVNYEDDDDTLVT